MEFITEYETKDGKTRVKRTTVRETKEIKKPVVKDSTGKTKEEA